MPSRTRIFVVAAFAFLALTLLGNLGATVQQMHLPGGSSGSITNIAAPIPSGASDVVRSWRGWNDYLAQQERAAHAVPRKHSRQVLARPSVVLAGWLLVDSIFFAPSLALLVFLLARRRFAAPASQLTLWLAWAQVIALIYLFFDELENILTGFYIFGPSPPIWVVQGASIGKVAALVAAALPSVLSLVLPASNAPPNGERFAKIIVRLRVAVAMSLVLTAVFLFLPGNVRPQLADVVRTWTLGDDPSAAVWALAMLVVVMVSIWLAGAIAIARTAESAPAQPSHAFRTRAGCFGPPLVFAITGGLRLFSHVDVFWPLGLVVSVIWFANTIGRVLAGAPSAVPAQDWDAKPALAVFSALPALSVAALVLRSADLAGPWPPKANAVVAFAIAYGLFRGMLHLVRSTPLPTAKSAAVALGALGTIAIGFAVWVDTDVVPHSWTIGAVGLLILAVSIVCATLGLVEYVQRRPPGGLLALLGIRRMPIISLLAIVMLATGALDKEVGFHRARPFNQATTSTVAQRHHLTLTNAAKSFASQVGASAGKKITPLFVIASSGGGARAAYWTLLATNCLFGATSPPSSPNAACSERAPWNHTFAASGISGGSVGLAMYAAAESKHEHSVAVTHVFGDGGVDPVIGSMMFVELPNTLITHNNWPDRAAALEESWEQKQHAMAQGLYGTQLTQGADGSPVPQFPVLLLNSSSVADGCRINVSVLDLANEAGTAAGTPALATTCRSVERFGSQSTPDAKSQPLAGTWDVDDFVCHDIRLSTAALMSARFPFVSPTGALQRCAGKGSAAPKYVFGVDGGYVDSSAASPLAEMLDSARATVQRNLRKTAPSTCVQPVVLQIDNGYSDVTKASDPSRPRELLAPLTGTLTSAGARADTAREALALAANGRRCKGVDIPTYLHLYPQMRPGIEAPLGWSLSAAARDDLDDQLSSPGNTRAICLARRWLTDHGTCAPPPTTPSPLGAAQVPGGRGVPAILIAAALLVVYISIKRYGELSD